jgi:hypothetical protein
LDESYIALPPTRLRSSLTWTLALAFPLAFPFTFSFAFPLAFPFTLDLSCIGIEHFSPPALVD